MLPPVVKTLAVPLPPVRAFEIFTARMADWWPFATHSLASARGTGVAALVIEPRVGGAVTETGEDGTACPWGRVLAWEPGRRFAMTWHVGRDAAQASRVEVTFEPVEAGCRVTLTHSGWEALGGDFAAIRQNYLTGWDHVFGARFAAACAA